MKPRMKRTTWILALATIGLATTSLALAHPAPGAAPGGPPPAGGPPPGHRLPLAEAVATIPGLDATQQTRLVSILKQRHDELGASRRKWQEAMVSLREKARSDRERILDQSDKALRQALGEKGFRAYAQWRLAQMAPPPGRPGPGHHRPGGPMGPGGAPGASMQAPGHALAPPYLNNGQGAQ